MYFKHYRLSVIGIFVKQFQGINGLVPINTKSMLSKIQYSIALTFIIAQRSVKNNVCTRIYIYIYIRKYKKK